MYKKQNIKYISEIGIIAALYIAMGMLFASTSFGIFQIRIAEAFTIMPAIKKKYIYSLTIGCFLTNLVGFQIGCNPLGLVDVFLGTLATCVSAILTYKLRYYKIKGLPIIATIPPVLINAVIIGAEVTYIAKGTIFDIFFLHSSLCIGVGQFISCTVIGTALFWIFRRISAMEKFV